MKVNLFLMMMTYFAASAGAQTVTSPFVAPYGARVLERGDTFGNDDGRDIGIDYLETKNRRSGLVDIATGRSLGGAHVQTWPRHFGRTKLQLSGGKDPIRDGAIMGAEIGVGIALAMSVALCSESGCDSDGVVLTIAVLGAAGAGIGALVDASLSISPIVTKHRKGAVLSVAW